MNVSKKLFSGILCGSLLLASAPAQCGPKKYFVVGGLGGAVAAVSLLAYTWKKLEKIEKTVYSDKSEQEKAQAKEKKQKWLIGGFGGSIVLGLTSVSSLLVGLGLPYDEENE